MYELANMHGYIECDDIMPYNVNVVCTKMKKRNTLSLFALLIKTGKEQRKWKAP